MRDMEGVLYLLLLLCASLYGCEATPAPSKRIPSFAGPYTCYGERLDACDDPSAYAWKLSAHLSRFNPYKPSELQRITGNLTTTHPFDDKAWVDVKVSVRANNEWKQNAFRARFPIKGCSEFRTNLPSLFFACFKGVRPTGVCSGSSGTHIFNDTLDWVFPPIPIFPYGYYLAEVTAGPGTSKKPTFCVQAYIHVVPKAGV